MSGLNVLINSVPINSSATLSSEIFETISELLTNTDTLVNNETAINELVDQLISLQVMYGGYNETFNDSFSSTQNISNYTIGLLLNNILINSVTPLPAPIITLVNSLVGSSILSSETYVKLINSFLMTVNNSTNFIGGNTISESIDILNTIAIIYDKTVSENLSVSSSIILDTYVKILETVYTSNLVTPVSISNLELSEIISLTNKIIFLSNIAISENIEISQGIIEYLDSIIKITSSIILSTTLSSQAVNSNILTNLIQFSETLERAFIDSIIDIGVYNSTLSEVIEAINSILNQLVIENSILDSKVYLLSLTSLLESVSNLSYSHILSNILNDYVVINIPTISGSNKYLGYNFSPETRSVTNYTNFNFTGSCKFNNKYLFINSNGLFEYGGILDNSTPIQSTITTSALSFDNSNLKSIPNFYLGYSSDNLLYLKVRVDGKGEFHYKLNKKSNELETKKIDIGKGLVGRYFQFELITSADNFNLESMEFYPIQLKRKL